MSAAGLFRWIPRWNFKNTDRSCCSFVAREHKRPVIQVRWVFLKGKSQMLPYRTWAITSSSFSRQSGRREEFASTEKLGVVVHVEARKLGTDEPSKLKISFRELPSPSSSFFSLINFAATSWAYILFSRYRTIPGRVSLLQTHPKKPSGAHLKASITNRRCLVVVPGVSKLRNKIVTMTLVLKGGTAHQVYI